ncbi:hypothetical protein EVAR_84992_1 [Eumeta japonica]|uniref:Uncharacterized protein n=1 Tax=Eumeta variegata TaxID=151549 RepID=A0A4C1W936_EUMVA|nr:hypothetical protein EVAR_84992_1 [Eumeta japonica]
MYSLQALSFTPAGLLTAVVTGAVTRRWPCPTARSVLFEARNNRFNEIRQLVSQLAHVRDSDPIPPGSNTTFSTTLTYFSLNRCANEESTRLFIVQTTCGTRGGRGRAERPSADGPVGRDASKRNGIFTEYDILKADAARRMRLSSSAREGTTFDTSGCRIEPPAPYLAWHAKPSVAELSPHRR